MNLGTLVLAHVGYGAAFLAGLASFISPCVLPLIPAWLTLVTGLSFEDLASDQRKGLASLKLFWPTLLFVLGFAFVFCALGAAAGWAGELLRNYGHFLRYITGALMIFFGLYLAGILVPSFLAQEKRADIRRRPLGLAGAFVVGMGFAAGWTPCVGPALGGILALAASEQSAGLGLRLLAVYSLGLWLPFILLSLAWGTVWGFLCRVRPVERWSGRILGIFLMVLGVLLISGHLNLGLS